MLLMNLIYTYSMNTVVCCFQKMAPVSDDYLRAKTIVELFWFAMNGQTLSGGREFA